MDNLHNKVAVITGAASGIGLALAQACAAEGMRVALVDLPGEHLNAAAAALRESGHGAQAYGCDVSSLDAVRALAASVKADFGAVHLLCNNAGISGVQRFFWNYTDADWQRMLDINLRGVINGLQIFLPEMVAQNEGHIINTSSMAGLIATPMNAPYCTAKFGVIALSEVLSFDLQRAGSHVGVSVLCPGQVKTAIGKGRMRESLANLEPAEQQHNIAITEELAHGMDADDVAQLVLTAIRTDQFYVLTHTEGKVPIENRMRTILEDKIPRWGR